MIRLILSLLVVLGGLLAVRWWIGRGGLRLRSGLRVVSRASLGRNSTVAVVAVGDERYYLVGAGEQGISLLDRLDPEIVASLEGGTDAPSDPLVDLVDRRVPMPPTAGVSAATTSVDLTGGIVFEGGRTDALVEGPGNGLVRRMREMTLRAPGRVPPDARLR